LTSEKGVPGTCGLAWANNTEARRRIVGANEGRREIGPWTGFGKAGKFPSLCPDGTLVWRVL